MTIDLPPSSRSTKPRIRKPQLRVVFDTNALYVGSEKLGSASDLVRQEIASLISDSKYPDLEILWYLPAVVRHERQYQMQTEALKLRFPINKIERLLGHNLALPDETLLKHVEHKTNEKRDALGLRELSLDCTLVDWQGLIRASTYRLPPFEAGEKEKGFRDAIVAETFLQLANDSPKTAKVCRVVLVTSDALLRRAVVERIVDLPNTTVLPNIEDLKGLINTLISDVGEGLIAELVPRAVKLFFVSADYKGTLFYKAKIEDQIKDRFKAQLKQSPEGTTFRDNGRWTINHPNFSRKEGRRVFWTSRIFVDVEAGSLVKREPPTEDYGAGSLVNFGTRAYVPKAQPDVVWGSVLALDTNWLEQSIQGIYVPTLGVSEKKIITHKGKDIFEVLWSAELNMAKDLKKSAVEEIKHVELNCQPIS